ncbi:MAG: PepSY domain-containing protein, partial [Rhizomicrobium sp.]
RIVAVRDPSGSFLAWQRPLHQGVGLGPVWRALVFLTGLVPTLFVVTGMMMWLKKRRRNMPMSAVLAEEGAG